MKNAMMGAVLIAASALSVTTFTDRAEAVCCGACCLIDGKCRSAGTSNPDDSCQHCDPTLSTSAWSNITGCTPTGAGGSGHGGSGGGSSSDDEGCSCRVPGAPAGPAGSVAGLLALAGAAVAWGRRLRR